MPNFVDHPLRTSVAQDLHTRPFPLFAAPQEIGFVAFKHPHNAAGRDRSADHAHLLTLLEHYGCEPPPPDARHFLADIGEARLKWESHSEFVTYSIFLPRLSDEPFSNAPFDYLPDGFLERVPGNRLTSALIRLADHETEDGIHGAVDDWFARECVATSYVLNKAAIIAGDFKLDENGHMRFAVFTKPKTGAGRTGRIIQRICEVEAYKSMSLLGLARARALGPKITEIDETLTQSAEEMIAGTKDPAKMLNRLLAIAKELEELSARTSFRFDATRAYSTLVEQRIGIMREEHFHGRQTFTEFMKRRFEPLMRTVEAVEGQLASLETRAMRAANLLRTQVDVARSAQNQKLMRSMDRRADMQLKLQKTVEGLSVVAISYYAVNLSVYLLAPVATSFGISKTWLAAAMVVPVVLAVWMVIRRIRKIEH